MAFLTDNFNSYNGGGIDAAVALHGQGGWLAGTGTFPDGFWVTTNYEPEGGFIWEGAKGVYQWSPISSGHTEAVRRDLTFPADGSQSFQVGHSAFDSGCAFAIEVEMGVYGGSPMIGVSIRADDTTDYVPLAFYRDALGEMVPFAYADIPETWYTIQIEWRSSDSKVRYNIFPLGSSGMWTDWVARIAGTPIDFFIGAWSTETDVTVWWDNFVGTGEAVAANFITGNKYW
jgi:hypothetical protein